MINAYKITNENAQTRNGTQWGENITHTTSGNSNIRRGRLQEIIKNVLENKNGTPN